jgi:ATP-dependent DNA helicase 2 subunit 2
LFIADTVIPLPLSTVICRSGERLTRNPYVPTEEQLKAVVNFVDAMNLIEADKDEDKQVSKTPTFFVVPSVELNCFSSRSHQPSVRSTVLMQSVHPPHDTSSVPPCGGV